MTINFTIDSNYVITAVEINGITYNCSIQIDENWEPYVLAWVINDSDVISGVSVGDANDETRFGSYGDCSADIAPTVNVIEPVPTPEVNLVYMGTKYNYIKVWDGNVWLTDRTIGNRLWDTDGDGHLNYTINYLPVHIQFVQVNESDYSVVSESLVYTADHNGTWAIYDDGHWERLDNKGGKE